MYLESSDRDRYIAIIRKKLKKKRYEHCLRVEKMALKLAERYGLEEKDAQTAALLHDLAKSMSDQDLLAAAGNYGLAVDTVRRMKPDLLHGPVAAEMMKRDLEIVDEDVLNAVRYHTTGRAGMSELEKIIYLADLTEEGRIFPGVDELREIAFRDLDLGMQKGVSDTLLYLMKRQYPIHVNSILVYNDLLKEK